MINSELTIADVQEALRDLIIKTHTVPTPWNDHPIFAPKTVKEAYERVCTDGHFMGRQVVSVEVMPLKGTP